MTAEGKQIKHLTVLVPGGLLDLEQMKTIIDAAEKYRLTFYLTTPQKQRMYKLMERPDFPFQVEKDGV